MNERKSSFQYEVLNPWADTDPIPLRGISQRMTDMKDKTIGLFANHKRAASRVRDMIGEKLSTSIPSLSFSVFPLQYKGAVSESKHKLEFEEWLKGVDAVVASVGD